MTLALSSEVGLRRRGDVAASAADRRDARTQVSAAHMAARPRLAEPEPTANVRVFEDVDEASAAACVPGYVLREDASTATPQKRSKTVEKTPPTL